MPGSSKIIAFPKRGGLRLVRSAPKGEAAYPRFARAFGALPGQPGVLAIEPTTTERPTP